MHILQNMYFNNQQAYKFVVLTFNTTRDKVTFHTSSEVGQIVQRSSSRLKVFNLTYYEGNKNLLK